MRLYILTLALKIENQVRFKQIVFIKPRELSKVTTTQTTPLEIMRFISIEI